MQSKSASIIILSGGTSKRFGSDKSRALLAGQSLISWILASIPPDFEIVIVGADPMIKTTHYLCTQEAPPGGGPVAGFKAGLELCTSNLVILIATDMPFVMAVTPLLLNSLTADDESVMYVDAQEFAQPFAAVYRMSALQRAFRNLGEPQGKSMRELLVHLKVHEIAIDAQSSKSLIDIDTAADLERAIEFLIPMKDNSPL